MYEIGRKCTNWTVPKADGKGNPLARRIAATPVAQQGLFLNWERDRRFVSFTLVVQPVVELPPTPAVKPSRLFAQN
jgi:hypothetical protein